MLIVPIESPVSGSAVRTFDVPVDLLLRVQVLQALEDLPQDGGDLGLVQGPRLQLGGHRQGGTNDRGQRVDRPHRGQLSGI